MPSRNSWSIGALMLLGIAFACANLWFAAARSTIPLEINGQVTRKERLIEKTVGVDDVYLVTLGSGRIVQVDGLVFDAMTEGQAIDKVRFSNILAIDDKPLTLEWSRDVDGMLWVMPATVLVCVLLGIAAYGRQQRHVDRQASTPIDV